MSELQKIGLQRRNKFLLKNGNGIQSNIVIKALLADVSTLGFTLDGDLINVFKTLDDSQFITAHSVLVDTLKNMVGANAKYRPLFRNFPHDLPDGDEYFAKRVYSYLRNVFELTEQDSVALSCGHIVEANIFNLDDFGACPICQNQVNELSDKDGLHIPLKDITPFKIIGLMKKEEILDIFENLIGGKSILSEKDKSDISTIVSSENEEVIRDYFPHVIPVKENLALISGLLIKKGANVQSLLADYFKTATDVLRLATALCDGDISLKGNTKFKLKNAQRTLLLGLLDNINNPEEDMLRHKGKWLRLGECLHPGAKKKRFKNSFNAFYVLRNKPESIETFNSKVESLVLKAKELDENAFKALVDHLSTRPGELARRLDFVLCHALDENYVIKAFKRCVYGVATPTLLVLKSFLNSRTEKLGYRYFLPKGNVAKIQFKDSDDRDVLSKEIVKSISDIIDKELMIRFSKKDELGSVYIDDKLKNVLVPISQRNASDAFVSLARGSRVKIQENAKVVRLFCYWKETSHSSTVDVDLSAVALSEDFSYLDHVSYTQYEGKDSDSYHSGDVQSAPNGAAEFIDIKLSSFGGDKARYVAITLHSYNNQSFDEFECQAGFMEREHVKSGEAFEAKTVKQKFLVNKSSKAAMPLLLDLLTGEVIWADLDLKGDKYGNIESSINQIKDGCRVAKDLIKSRPNMYDLFSMHVESRFGKLVKNKEDADIILDINDAKNIDIISKNWL